MIRRIENGKAYAFTCPLITKADGTKFGKSEGGNIWLDPKKTSPYRFYQYWLNTSDEDAEKYIKIFTFLSKETIESLVNEHKEAPHLRNLQKKLAEEITVMVHSQEAFGKAVEASQVLFSNDAEGLKNLDEATFLELFEGVPQKVLSKEMLSEPIDIVEFVVAQCGFMPSNAEARRAFKENSLSLNRIKVNESHQVSASDLINNQFILLQRGKKNYFVVRFT
jgi:tyrosyl-tRNA synthetase